MTSITSTNMSYKVSTDLSSKTTTAKTDTTAADEIKLPFSKEVSETKSEETKELTEEEKTKQAQEQTMKEAEAQAKNKLKYIQDVYHSFQKANSDGGSSVTFKENMQMGSILEDFKEEINSYKGKVSDSDFEKLQGMSSGWDNKIEQNIIAYIESLENDPEKLLEAINSVSAEANKIKEKMIDRPSFWLKLMEKINEKYPQERINELQKKASSNEKSDNSKDFVLSSSLDNAYTSNSQNKTSSTQESFSYTSNPLVSNFKQGSFGSLTLGLNA